MEDNEIKQKFEEIYKSKIEPNLKRLEIQRIEEKKKYDLYVKVSIIACISGILLSVLCFLIKSPFIIFLIIIGFIVAIPSSILSTKIANNYRKMIKPFLLKPVLSIFGNFRLENKEILSLKEIKSLGLYHRASSKRDDDIIVGTYKDIPISLIEAALVHTESRGKSPTTVSDFNGLILKIKTNKSCEGITVGDQKVNIDNYIKLLKEVAQKNPDMCPPEMLKFLDSPIFKTISQTQKFMNDNKLFIKNGKLCVDIFDNHTKNKITKKLEQVILEDVEFNNNYNIYSDNQVESRFLLTPTFMERLKNIQATFLVLSVNFVFNNGYLYLFLNGSSACTNMTLEDNNADNNGFFEVGSIDKTLLDKKIYLKLFRELVSIFSLINYFKLNEKTGL